jgi:hypothetical protein
MTKYWMLIEEEESMGSFKIFHDGQLVNTMDGDNAALAEEWAQKYQNEHGGEVNLQYEEEDNEDPFDRKRQESLWDESTHDLGDSASPIDNGSGTGNADDSVHLGNAGADSDSRRDNPNPSV